MKVLSLTEPYATLIKEKKINSILINIREGLNIIFEDILNNKIS